ncbi:MAG: CoA pyrophosphatase [Myxococcales bacterium]|nr:CoA pyrophosphatase [Myxococcales bacterium]
MPLSADELERALADHTWVEHPALPGRRNHRRAGVSVPLDFRGGRVEALLTLRPTRLNRHGGEVSWPGGRPEAGDAGLEGTARRETHEELGLQRLRLLGRLSSMPVYTSDYRLEPFVVAVDPDEPLKPDPGEVERVLRLDLAEALGRPLEGIHARTPERSWTLPLFLVEDYVVFGATALTLMELLGVVADATGHPMPDLVPSALSWEDLRDHGALAARQRSVR